MDSDPWRNPMEFWISPAQSKGGIMRENKTMHAEREVLFIHVGRCPEIY